MQYFIHKHMDYKNGGSQLNCFKCHGKFEDARLQYRNSSSCPLNPMSKKTQTGFWFVKIPWDIDGIHHWKSKFWRSFGIMKKTSKNESSKKLPKFVFLWKMMKNHFPSSALALPIWNKKLLRICIPSKIEIQNCCQNLTTF